MDTRATLTEFALRASRKAASIVGATAHSTESRMSWVQASLSHKIDFAMKGLDCPTAQQYLDGCSRLTRPIKTEETSRQPSIVVLGILDTSAIFGGMATLFRVAAALAQQMGRPLVVAQTDYEPIFYSNSDDFVAAEVSYLSGKFVPIFNTSELRKFFATKDYFNASDACFFEPAVELPAIPRSQRPDDPHKLFFYARPGVARNLFRTGLAAIDLALGQPEMTGWEVHCAGSTEVPEVRFRNGTKLIRHGKMAAHDYFASLGTYDMCLSPMLAPHPNYPTLEFAMAGVPVVTTRWETKTDLEHYSGLIRLGAPTPEALAERMVEVARMTDIERATRAQQGNIPTAWDETLAPAASKLAELLK